MGKEKLKFEKNINIRNKQASFEFQFMDTYVAGIMLTGTEIKSIRLAKVQIQNAYCFFNANSELFIQQLHISPYELGTIYNHEPMRVRKLLLKKRELRKLERGIEEKGLTIVPIRLFVNEKGLAKIEIALAKGKKLHDKRQDIKAKDTKREMDRTFKV